MVALLLGKSGFALLGGYLMGGKSGYLMGGKSGFALLGGYLMGGKSGHLMGGKSGYLMGGKKGYLMGEKNDCTAYVSFPLQKSCKSHKKDTVKKRGLHQRKVRQGR